MVQDSGGGGAKCFPAGWNMASKPCDSCKSAAALLFCRKDMVFLCMVCDMKLHNRTRHERVWMCELCEHAPAYVTCKADAAALCVTCDRDIHSVNPLASRHERIPVVPFYDSAEAVVKTTGGNVLDPISSYGSTEFNSFDMKEDHVSLEIPTDMNGKFPSNPFPVDMKVVDLFSAAADHLYDFGFAVPTDVRLESQFHDSVNDCVVPVQRTSPTKNFQPPQIVDHQSSSSPSHSHNVNISIEIPSSRYWILFIDMSISRNFRTRISGPDSLKGKNKWVPGASNGDDNSQGRNTGNRNKGVETKSSIQKKSTSITYTAYAYYQKEKAYDYKWLRIDKIHFVVASMILFRANGPPFKESATKMASSEGIIFKTAPKNNEFRDKNVQINCNTKIPGKKPKSTKPVKLTCHHREAIQPQGRGDDPECTIRAKQPNACHRFRQK
ncbi:hypothetical protein L1887_12182 [Cichorium endivia]|nr:hypothetical protein L1887_12182 [Cichorium endivia]